MRRALGKGLTQLLGEESEAAPSSIAVSAIRPNSQQPRRHFDEDLLAELARSIKEVGVLLPLIVRPVADGEYELIAGERRWRAAQLAGLTEVPVIVRSAGAQDSLELALIENVQREDISPVECAHAYKQLQGKFGLNQEQIAQKVGKSRSAVANTLRLLKLPEAMQRSISEGSVTEGHARAILMADGPIKQQALFDKIVGEGVTVREAERLARGEPKTGQTNGKPSGPRRPSAEGRRTHDPNQQALEQGLSEYFGTPVAIHSAEVGGKIVVEFYSDDDLQRILEVIGVHL